ncbi:MAG: hypothetical protein WCT14_20060 [Treponemataceae bacterium]
MTRVFSFLTAYAGAATNLDFTLDSLDSLGGSIEADIPPYREGPEEERMVEELVEFAVYEIGTDG